MGNEGHEPEDFLLERLNEAASGDAAVRQLRRRYDSLRSDYENLLDRLGELEDRLKSASTEAPRTATATATAPISQGIAEALAAPLLRLRDDYLAALNGIQGLVSGLEGLAAGFKGQHTAAGTRPAPEPQQAPATETASQPAGSRQVHKMQVDVKGSGFGELLDFQERLSQLPGVSRVSINAIDNERATLVVELEHGR